MIARTGWRRLGLALVICISLIAVAGVGLYFWLLADLPPLDNLYDYTAAPSSKIYDRRGRLLFEMPPPHGGRHSPVPLEEIPESLRQAVIATEDARFYQHPGVDAWAIVRALWINVRGGEILSGGSTITQQLARNLLLSPEERYAQTLRRKMREAVLAWRIARRYSKDEILELYLNEIYFGAMAYGAEAAAQTYFGKHVRDLDVAESAMLAGLPQAPAYLNPLENLPAAKERQAVVLDLMVRHGYASASEARRAKEEKLYFAPAPFDIRAPHFTMYVRGLLEQKLGLERLEQGGLEVHTTLDLDLNETARDIIRYRLIRLAECQTAAEGSRQRGDCPPGGHNVRNAALIALDPQTGEILAMVGSPDYFSARIDGAVNGTTALRQPGSSIKPLTYAAAFEGGTLTPATMMLDVRTSFVTKEGASYVPLNYDLQFRGPVRLREVINEIDNGVQNGLWKGPYDFTVSGGRCLILATGKAENLDQYDDDDDMKIVLDSKDFGYNTARSWDGNSDDGQPKTIIIDTVLAAGSHQLSFYSEVTPILYDATVLESPHGDVVINQQLNETAPAGSNNYLWKTFTFNCDSGMAVVYISGSADEEPGWDYLNDNIDSTDDDELRVMIDDIDYGWGTDSAMVGNTLFGDSKTILIMQNLPAGTHTLKLYANETPTVYNVVVYVENKEGTSGLEASREPIVHHFHLGDNYPNPFNPTTTIPFTLPKTERVRLAVYDVKGSLIRELVNRSFAKGKHSVQWDGRDAQGNEVASGVYFYQLSAESQKVVRKMVKLQ